MNVTQEMVLQYASFILKIASLIMTTLDEGFFWSETISWLDTHFVQNHLENQEGNTHSM